MHSLVSNNSIKGRSGDNRPDIRFVEVNNVELIDAPGSRGTPVRFGAKGCWSLDSICTLANLYDGNDNYSSGPQSEQDGLVTILSVGSGSKLTGVTKVYLKLLELANSLM